RGDQGQRRLHAVQGTVSLPGHLGPARPRIRRLGFRPLPVGHRLDARLRGRQLRAGRRALPRDRPPERQRAGDLDGRRVRQGLWLVAEENLSSRIGTSSLQRLLLPRGPKSAVFDGFVSWDVVAPSPQRTDARNPMMQTRVPALAILALLGLGVAANAQAPCPELTRLRSEAQDALKQSRTASAVERCYMYIRLSVAWSAAAQYANDN